jgi:XRE family transcriptional regulator, aerobic/anaerobic benzoate catabolism transcriptional regulator
MTIKLSKIRKVKDEDLQKLGLKIKKLREKRGFNRDVFAREAEISKYYLYRLEYGNANPSILQLRKVAKCLGVSVKSMIDF